MKVYSINLTINSLEKVLNNSFKSDQKNIVTQDARENKLKIAEKVLESFGLKIKANNWVHVNQNAMESFNWRQFGLTLCSGLIKQTSLEGGMENVCADAALEFVSVLSEHESPFFKIFRSDEKDKRIFNEIKNILDVYKKHLNLRPSRSPDQALQDPEYLLTSAKRFLSEIRHDLQHSQSIYVPLMYREGPGFQGHAMACKISNPINKADDYIVITLFNLGNGTQNHPIINYSLNDHQRSYSFFPLKIKKSDFFGKGGEAAICTLFRYMTDPVNDNLHYDAQDLYDIFLSLSLNIEQEETFQFEHNIQEYEAEEQVVGNCPQMAVEMVITDFLIGKKLNRLEREKFFLNRDFYVLIQGFQAFKINHQTDKFAAELLNDACASFALKIIDFHKQKEINLNELTCSQFVLEFIQREIKQTKRTIVQMSSIKTVGHFPFEFPVIPSFKKDASLKVDTLVIEDYVISQPVFKSSSCKDINTTLQTWIDTAEKLPTHIVFSYIEACIKTLPIPLNISKNLPRGFLTNLNDLLSKSLPAPLNTPKNSARAKDNIWGQINPSEGLSIIKNLKALLLIGLKQVKIAKSNWKEDQELDFTRQFMMIYTIYAITDKLARLNESKTKLSGYLSPFIPKLDETFPREFSCLPIAQDNRRYTQLYQYFTDRISPLQMPREHEKMLFPIGETIDVTQCVLNLIQNTNDTKWQHGKYHIEFLAKHIKETTSLKNQSNLFAANWYTCLPEEVQHLYYFSFLSYLLFACPKEPFPDKLEFSRIQSSDNHDCLLNKTISAYNQKQQNKDTFQYSPNKTVITKYHPLLCFETYSSQSIDLESEQYKNLLSNEAICFRAPKDYQKSMDLFEPDIRQVLYITRNENLSLWMSLETYALDENLYLLENPVIQKILDTILFHPHYLIERMNAAPKNVTKAFRTLIKKGLEYFNNPQHCSTTLYLIKTGVCFETFTLEDQKRQDVIKAYKDTLNVLLEKPLNNMERDQGILLLAFLETNNPDTTPLELFPLLYECKYINRESSFKKGDTWLGKSQGTWFRDSSIKHCNALNNPLERNPVCFNIVNKLLGRFEKYKDVINGLSDWTGVFPKFSSGPFIIDFYQGTLIHKEFGTLCLGSEFKNSILTRSKLNQIQVFEKLYWNINNITLTDIDQTYAYDLKTDHLYNLEKNNITPSDQPSQEINVCMDLADNHNQAFLAFAPRLSWSYFAHEDGKIIIYDRERERPIMVAQESQGDFIYTRVDKNKMPLAGKLLNASKLTPEDHLYYYTASFTYPDKVLCFIDANTSAIEWLHFYVLGLEFTQEKQGLASSQYPGYYLIATPSDLEPFPSANAIYEEIQTQLNHYKGIFCLYNPVANTWRLLFPIGQLVQEPGLFSTGVCLAPEFKLGLGPSSFNTYIYLPELQEFSSNPMSDASYLALVCLFKMQRDYKKAYQYLKKLSASVGFYDTNISNLMKLEDHSVASLAFNLHFSLLILDNLHLITEENLSKNNRTIDWLENFMYWTIKNYKLFHRHCNKSNMSSIPEFLSFNESHKQRTLLYFHDFYEKNGKDLLKEHPVLGHQYHVFFSADMTSSATIDLDEQTIHLTPAEFKKVSLDEALKINLKSIKSDYLTSYNPEKQVKYFTEQKVNLPFYPIRLKKLSLNCNFIDLYEMARKAPLNETSPFDFTLLALVKNISDASTLVSFLFIVRYFSNQFNDDQFSLSDMYTMEDAKLLEKQKLILNELESIKKHERYAKFLKLMNRTCNFHDIKTVVLSNSKSTKFNSPVVLNALPNATLENLKETIGKIYNTPFKISGGKLLACSEEEQTLFDLNQTTQHVLLDSDNISQLNEFIMKEVILKNNLERLHEKRSMLTPERMNQLCSNVNQWYYLQALQKLTTEKNNILPFDHVACPEISYFYLKTGKFPTQAQLEIYQWICEGISRGRNRHFQLAAGGGKTDVITPLLTLGAKKLGLMPVTCVTQSIYSVDKKNLKYNLNMINEDLAYLEIGMHMIKALTSTDLKNIYIQLKYSKDEGRGLIITRHAYDSMHLIRELACQGTNFSGDKKNHAFELDDKIWWSQKILNFFKEKCLLICDESHQNADPVTKAIFGTGEFITLATNESYHLLQLMLPLLGIDSNKISCQDGRDVSHVSNFANLKNQGAPTSKEVIDIQKTLAEYYWKTFFFKEAGAENKEAFINYWTDRSAEQPTLLREWAASKDMRVQASLAALTGHFLLVLLPDAMNLRTEIDHARSIYQEKFFDVPCRNKFPTTAEFEAYKTTVLTIKGNYQRGLIQSDIRKILVDMLKKSADEKTKGVLAKDTSTNLQLQQWIKDSGLPIEKIEDIDFSDKDLLSNLFNILSKKPEVIEYFLVTYCFPSIGNSSEQLFSTTTDLFAGFKQVVAFTATPRHILAYPRSLAPEDFKSDDLFRNNVKDKLLEKQNGNSHTVQNPEDIFEMKENKDFLKATIFIDPRGFFSHLTNLEVATKWIEANKTLEGVLFCKEERSEKVDRSESFCLLKRDGSLTDLEGSDIIQALNRQGYNWHDMKLGTLFDPARTESANILQKEGASAFFFLGDGLTETHLIQAVMRLRGFLTKNQTISWIIPKGLSKKISPNSESSQQSDILVWAKKNGIENDKMRIVLNAFQEIYFVIAREAREEILEAYTNSKSTDEFAMGDLRKIYDNYKNGFSEKVPVDAYTAFSDHEVERDSELALKDYAEKLYRRFSYTGPFHQHSSYLDVLKIIDDVKTEIKVIYSAQTKAMNAQVEHQQEIKIQTERQQETEVPQPIYASPLNIKFGSIKIYHKESWQNYSTTASKYYGSNFLNPRLCFYASHIETGTTNGETITKPIDFLTIYIKEDKSHFVWYAEAKSNDNLRQILIDLKECPEKGAEEVKGLEHTAFIVSSGGHLIQKGCQALEPNEEIVKTILSSQDFKDIIIDASLLKGQIISQDRLRDRLLERIRDSGWDQFNNLWTIIRKVLPCQERAHDRAVEDLKKAYDF